MSASVVEAVAGRALAAPDALAVAVCGERLSYGELAAALDGAAAALAAAGLGAGERCVLALPTGRPLVAAFLGAQRLGAIPAAVDEALPAVALAARVAEVGARLVVVAPERAAEVARAVEGAGARAIAATALEGAGPRGGAARPWPEAGAVSHLQFTSGTTGRPKAAVITHRNVVFMATIGAERLRLGPSDVMVSWMPLHHDFGLVRFLLAGLLLGIPVHLLRPSILELGRWLATIGEVGATMTGSPDFGYRVAARLVSPEGVDLSTLRVALSGGEPVRKDTLELFSARFGLAAGVMNPGYGLAEGTLGLTCGGAGEPARVDAAGQVASGRPYRGVRVRVVDEAGREVPAGVRGCIETAGEHVFAGYWGDEAATAEVMRGEWLRTGDVGALDAEGWLTVLGRERAMIKRGGSAIAPREVEEAVDRVVGVRFSAAVGVPNEALGGTEDVVVVAKVRPEAVGPEPGAGAAMGAAVAAAARGAVGFAPGRVLLVVARTIPLTGSGKVRHAALREAVVSGALAGSGAVLWRG